MFPSEKKKLYYSIREVSQIIGLKEYVLRHWEAQFQDILRPKRQSGKRLYTESDIKVIRRIQELLHEKGMTTKGAQLVIKRNEEHGEVETALELLKSLRDFIRKFAHE